MKAARAIRSAVLVLAALAAVSSPPLAATAAAGKAASPGFGERRTLGLLAQAAVDEASGLAASRQNPGVLWTHNDSGGEPILWALDREGGHRGRFLVVGAENVDWEDIAIGPGPVAGRDYLFAGDIGDNRARRESVTVYRIPEPFLDTAEGAVDSALGNAVAIRLRYPDGPRDAETLLVDPGSGDLIVVSKREREVRVYRAPFPQPAGETTTMAAIATLPLTNVTAGDWSRDGSALLLKTYLEVRLWRREGGDDLAAMLAGPSVQLPYFPEPQGEAIAWDPFDGGYYTLSEERQGIPAYLYYYPPLEASAD